MQRVLIANTSVSVLGHEILLDLQKEALVRHVIEAKHRVYELDRVDAEMLRLIEHAFIAVSTDRISGGPIYRITARGLKYLDSVGLCRVPMHGRGNQG